MQNSVSYLEVSFRWNEVNLRYLPPPSQPFVPTHTSHTHVTLAYYHSIHHRPLNHHNHTTHKHVMVMTMIKRKGTCVCKRDKDAVCNDAWGARPQPKHNSYAVNLFTPTPPLPSLLPSPPLPSLLPSSPVALSDVGNVVIYFMCCCCDGICNAFIVCTYNYVCVCWTTGWLIVELFPTFISHVMNFVIITPYGHDQTEGNLCL